MNILFVCTGNICRSPTAHGVLRQRAAGKNWRVDSAGTHAYHVGEAPDPRSVSAAKKRGVQLADLRARQVTIQDFYDFDIILALDSAHLAHLQRMAPTDAKAEGALFLEYAGLGARDVADPYYGGAEDFERVLDVVEEGAAGMIRKVGG